MIRFLLLGGRWGPVPWTFFVALGGACLFATVLFALLDPTWSTYPTVGWLEVSLLAVISATLLAVGLHRRARELRRS
jgi:hypothetical protein